MEMTGQQHISASKEEVWNALNDADVLKVCIPGCEELIKSSETQMSAIAVIKVGPVKARFQGAVTLSDLDPPNGYRITGEGQGGVAGFAKGTASVRLEEVQGATILHYNVDAQIGGKLAQLGGRLIDVTAKQMSGMFFKRFAEEIQARQNPDKPVANETIAPAAQRIATSPAAPARVGVSQAASPVAPAANKSPAGLLTIAAVVFVAVLAAMWAAGSGLLPSLVPRAGLAVVDGPASVISPELASVVQLLMAAAIGYLFGSRARHEG